MAEKVKTTAAKAAATGGAKPTTKTVAEDQADKAGAQKAPPPKPVEVPEEEVEEARRGR